MALSESQYDQFPHVSTAKGTAPSAPRIPGLLVKGQIETF